MSVPGEQDLYSTFGYAPASAIVEGASRQPFLDFPAEGIFAPLGMRRTTADRIDEIIEDRTAYDVPGPHGGVRS